MSAKKADIKHLMREHLSPAFLLVEKPAHAGKAQIVPGRRVAADTVLSEARHLIVDVSIYAHLFINVETVGPRGSADRRYVKRLGSEFVDAFRRKIDEAFAQGYVVVVMILDKQCHTTVAKANTQKKRADTASADCVKARVDPIKWDLDAPTPLVVLDQPIAPMCAIKAVPSAFRYAIWEAMNHLINDYVAPAGCRLIVDMQAYEATNPDEPDDWLVSPRIEVLERYRAEVDALRDKLIEYPHWRHVARRLSTEFGRTGVYSTLPVCVQSTRSGVRLQPYVLPRCYNTCGETDLGVWRWTQLLLGTRKQQSLEVAERFTHTDRRPFVPDETERQLDACCGRSLIATSDSDFISGAMGAVGTMVADYVYAKRAAGESAPGYADIDEIGAYCPLVLMGDTYASTLGYAADASVFGKEAETRAAGGRSLTKVYELIDTHRFFCALLFDRYAAEGATPSRTVLALASSTPHDWYRRCLSFVTCCVVAGNDYLLGLHGMSHACIWMAYNAMLAHRAEVVALCRRLKRPLDDERGALPSQTAVLVNPINYVQFVKTCYWVSLRQKGGPHAPTRGISQMTYEQVAALTRAKYKISDASHAPDANRLASMYERTLTTLYYVLYGPTTVRRTLDETLVGWTPETRELEV